MVNGKKNLCKYKLKSECSEVQNTHSQKTLSKKPSTVGSVICHGKEYQIGSTNYQRTTKYTK